MRTPSWSHEAAKSYLRRSGLPKSSCANLGFLKKGVRRNNNMNGTNLTKQIHVGFRVEVGGLGFGAHWAFRAWRFDFRVFR